MTQSTAAIRIRMEFPLDEARVGAGNALAL
jgi:hypothetical protein